MNAPHPPSSTPLPASFPLSLPSSPQSRLQSSRSLVAFSAKGMNKAALKIAGKNMAISRPTNITIHNEVREFTDSSEQATLVLAETSPNHQFVRVKITQFSHSLRQSATQTVFVGLDTASEMQVSWHLLTLSTFPPDVRQRVWQQLNLLASLRFPLTPRILALWQVPKRQQLVFITPFLPSHSIDEYFEKKEEASKSVLVWLEKILHLLDSCRAAKLSPLHFSLENVRITDCNSLLIEDLVHLPDPRDARYLREFLHPSSTCDTAAFGHFVLRLREVLPMDTQEFDRLTDVAMTCFRHLHEDKVISLMRQNLQAASIPIKFTIDLEGVRRRIEFEYNPAVDSPEAISKEFVREFNLNEECIPHINRLIEKKVAGKDKDVLMNVDLITLSPATNPAPTSAISPGIGIGGVCGTLSIEQVQAARRALLRETPRCENRDNSDLSN